MQSSKKLLTLGFGCLVWLQVSAATAVIVGAKSPLKTLTKQQVKAIFLDQPVSLNTSMTIIPFDQTHSSKGYKSFYALIGLAPAGVNAYWSRMTFSGNATEPQALSSNQQALQAVMESPSAIAYVDMKEIPSWAVGHVKVVYGDIPDQVVAQQFQPVILNAAPATAQQTTIPTTLMDHLAATKKQTSRTTNFAVQLAKMKQQVAAASQSLKKDVRASAGSMLMSDAIWPTLSKHFVLGAYANHAEVKAQVKWFLAHRQLLDKILANAKPYIDYIYQQTQNMRLPAELALLPMVESGYNPYAYSNAGATGLWQMMPTTAASLGVKMNWWYDGRRDVMVSTQVALTYLRSLFLQLHSWPLAIAAYDAGEGTVENAVSENRKAGKPTNYWRLPLPVEAKLYFPKLMALADIISNPSFYGLTLPAVSANPFFKAVTISSQMTLTQISHLSAVSVAHLQRLNPGLRRWATEPNTTYDVLVPVKAAARFKAGVAKLSGTQQVTWTYHQVRQGETLQSIAANYGISTAELAMVNGLSAKANVQPGEGLLVAINLHTVFKTTAHAVEKVLPTQPFVRQPVDTVHAATSLKAILAKLHGQQ